MSALPASSVAPVRVESDPVVGQRLPTRFATVGVDALRPLISEWDRLSASASGNPFALSPWFTQLLWAHERAARQDLVVAVGRDDAGQLCALLPMVRERSRMPILGIDTLRPLTLFGSEVSAPVLAADAHPASTARLVEFLLGEAGPACDVIEFDTVAVGSELHLAMQDVAAGLDVALAQASPQVQPLVHPQTSEAGVELPGPNTRFRRNLRRAWRRAAQSGHQVECREISWEWQHWQDEVAQIYQARWGLTPREGSHALHDPRRLALVDALLQRLDRHFRAYAFGCFVDQRLAAYVVGLRGGHDAVLWATGMADEFRALNVGTLLWDSCLHTLAALPGVTRICLGKGTERYKLAWSDGSYPVVGLAAVRARGMKRRRVLQRYAALPSPPAVDG